jgi:hypothetical protein
MFHKEEKCMINIMGDEYMSLSIEIRPECELLAQYDYTQVENLWSGVCLY